MDCTRKLLKFPPIQRVSAALRMIGWVFIDPCSVDQAHGGRHTGRTAGVLDPHIPRLDRSIIPPHSHTYQSVHAQPDHHLAKYLRGPKPTYEPQLSTLPHYLNMNITIHHRRNLDNPRMGSFSLSHSPILSAFIFACLICLSTPPSF